MRNIHDIIAEKKTEIDVRMASYDLTYVIEHLSNHEEEYYIQEGLGETLKNVVRKVIEFIKSLIDKIKELVRNVIRMFRKKDKSAADLDARLQEINKAANAVGSSGAAAAAANGAANMSRTADELRKQKEDLDETKKANEKVNQKAQQTSKEAKASSKPKAKPKKAASVEELIKASNDEVRMIRYGSLFNRKKFMNEFLNTSERLLDDLVGDDVESPEQIMEMPENQFKRDLCGVMFKNPEANLIDYIKKRRLDDGEEETFRVKEKADIIISYIREAPKFLTEIEQAEKTITDRFKKLINILESGAAKKMGLLEDIVPEKCVNHIAALYRNACSTMTTIFNFVVISTSKAYNSYLSIGTKLLNDYEKAMGV